MPGDKARAWILARVGPLLASGRRVATAGLARLRNSALTRKFEQVQNVCERSITGALALVGLHNLNRKIIAFALLATMIPSLSMGWLSYVNSRRVLQEKVTQELSSRTAHTWRRWESASPTSKSWS